MASSEPMIRQRGMWTGTISFGLVSVPVSLFPALRRRAVHLRMLAPDGTPLSRQYVCTSDGKLLDADDIVRGYELDDGKLVLVSDDELESVEPDKSSDIQLLDFVELADIAPFHYDRPYFLAPSGGSSKAYRLLAHVMEKHGRAGIATFVMRGKEYLVAIIAERGLLMAETMRFADELRVPEDVGLAASGKEVPEVVLKQLRAAVESLTRKTVVQTDLKDRYAERFERLVRNKRKSRSAIVRKKAEEEEEEMDEETNVIDLVAVFRERMREAEAEDGSKADFSRMSKQELYERAHAAGIRGRSKMTKNQLADALAA